MLGLAAFIFGFFYWTIISLTKGWVSTLLYCTVYINLFFFFKTMLGDPGVDPKIYDHYCSIEFDEMEDLINPDEEAVDFTIKEKDND